MPYSTIDDLKTFFDEESLIELTDDENDNSKVDERLNAAIERADEEIDGYLGGRFGVPLNISPLPKMIRDISVDLAIVELYKRRGDFILDTKGIKSRRAEAIQRLKDIQLGTITFTGTGEPNLSQTRSRERKYSPSVIDKY